MTHKEMVANIAKELMLKLMESSVGTLKLSIRGGEEAINDFGQRFATLVSKVDTSLKGLD